MDKSQAYNAKRDLTQGNVVSKLLFFALPLILSNLVMQFYNVADSIIVGNFVGSDAIAAVGASFPIMMLFNALFMGVAMGAGIVVAQYFGAKNHEALAKAVSTTFTITLIVGAVITSLGLLLSKPLLSLLGTPANILSDSTSYLAIVFLGTIGSMIYMIGGGILRGLGDSKWPLYFLIICSALNIVLDLLFVVVFGWGVPGVAWATILSQVTSAVLVYVRINKGGYGIRFGFGQLKIDANSAKSILKLGLPSGIQSMTMSLGMLIIQSFANGFGSDFIAANSVVMRADGFAILPMMGIGMAVTTFTGQNMGAGKLDRAKEGIRAAAVIIIAIGVIMGVILWFFGIYVMRAFTDTPAVLEIGKRGIQVLAFTYCFMGLDHCFGGAMRGAGAAVAPMATALIANIARIPIAYFIAVVPGDYMGLFYSMAATMVLGCVMIMLYYKSGRWQNKAITGKQNAPVPMSAE